MTKVARNGSKHFGGTKVIKMDLEKSTENGNPEENPSDSIIEDFHGFKNEVKTPSKQPSTPITRSRSDTPQSVNGNAEKAKKDLTEKPKSKLALKKGEEDQKESTEKTNEDSIINGNETESTKEPVIKNFTENGDHHAEDQNGTESSEEKCIAENERPTRKSNDGVDMEPLVLGVDEDHPELHFDENSDKESGQNSPMPRCRTRRSLSRNIPTPKTPKSLDTDSEKNPNSIAPTPDPSETDENKPETLNDAHDSIDLQEVSTQAEAGSDSTRLDFMVDSSIASNNSDDRFLNDIREKSLKDTLRGLTPRRTIRPLSGDYLKKAIKNNQNKSNLNLFDHDMTDRIGVKRKSRSITPEERKRFKQDSSFASYLSSPFNTIRNKFKSSENDSTPKLTSYKDGNHDIHEEKNLEVVPYEPLQDKRSWCSLM